MQHRTAADFLALSPAKAKSSALALFQGAMIDGPSADWQGVAIALHSVVTRKRASKTGSDIAMQDAADAGEFAPWLDYEAKGKATTILRGRVTVAFADGWSRTVGVLQAKGKGWSIGKAVIFAVACYQSAAARRLAGDDGLLYCGEHFLPGLIAVPEISSIESADSDETRAGDLVWDPVAANAATRELRAGQVDATTYGPLSRDAFMSARLEIGRRLGLMKTGAEIQMMRANHEAAERVHALLSPWDRGRDPERVAFCESAFAPIMNADEEGYPMRDESDPRAGLATADHFTALAATEIVGGQVDADVLADWSAGLSAVSYRERFLLVEDALLAWPALVEPCAFVDGEAVMGIPMAEEDADEEAVEVVEAVIPVSETVDAVDVVEEEAAHHEDSAPPAAGEAGALEQPEPVPPAAPEAVAEPLPAAKPRYRFSPITGLYEIVPAGER